MVKEPGKKDVKFVLRKAFESKLIPSMIFWGPPGTGKTTLANIIANGLNRPFYSLSAINSGVKDVREAIASAKDQGLFGTGNPILFIDEIHRFSKSQQDSLLGAVEKGFVGRYLHWTDYLCNWILVWCFSYRIL